MKLHDRRIRGWAVPAGYTAGRYLDIPPGRAVYPGKDGLDGKAQVVDIVAVLVERNTSWNGIYCAGYPAG